MISPFRKVLEQSASTKQSKDERNTFMQNLVTILMNCLYGVEICKEINEFYKSKPEHWMHTEVMYKKAFDTRHA